MDSGSEIDLALALKNYSGMRGTTLLNMRFERSSYKTRHCQSDKIRLFDRCGYSQTNTLLTLTWRNGRIKGNRPGLYMICVFALSLKEP
ncbi:MAG TPA: hypothetical protein DC054_13545 [Blastocatellia bacterium]|nr:hypothetical protein [Blastocatellia bacterium]